MDDREGRFLLRRIDDKTNVPAVGFQEGGSSFRRKLSKREKKQLKKQEKMNKLKSNAANNENEGGVAEKLYTELPETSFTRSISNPEAVMRRRRQQKLERKLQQFRSKDGGPDTGGTLKIYGESLCRDVPYKTLLLSVRDTAAQVVREMLAKYGMEREADPHNFCLVQVNTAALPDTGESKEYHGGTNNREYILDDDECPLAILMNHPSSRGSIMFHVRRRPADYHPRKRKKKPLQKWNKGSDLVDYRYEEGYDRLPFFLELNPDGSDIVSSTPKRHRLHPNVTEVGSERPMNASQHGHQTQSLQLFGPNVHPRHCVIAHTEGIVTVTPCSRDAETYVNGQRIYETTILQHGAVVKFGRIHNFRFLDPSADDRTRQRHDSARQALDYTYDRQTSKEDTVSHGGVSTGPPGSNTNGNNNSSNGNGPSNTSQNYETTFDVDGNVETVSTSSLGNKEETRSQRSVGSSRDGNRLSNYERYPRGNDPILPAVLEFREETEEAFLHAVVTDLDPSSPHFKLAPTYTLYLVARYRASTHYRPELTPPERAHRLTVLLARVAAMIHNVIQDRYADAKSLAFWMANSSELLHFLKSDRHICAFSLDAQDILAECVQLAFRNLVSCLQGDLAAVMPNFLTEREDPNPEDDSTGSVLQVLSSAMDLLRRCRVNAALTIQLFSQLFHFVNMWSFNKVVTSSPGVHGTGICYCTREWGLRLKAKLAQLEVWAERQGLELAADCHLARIIQAAHLLQAPKYNADDLATLSSTCFKLNSLQLRALLSKYQPAPDEPRLPHDLIDNVVMVAENVADELARSDGREVRLEEEAELQLPFLLPEDGYSCDVVRGVPQGLAEFLAPLQHAGLCRLTTQPTSSGLWTIYMSPPEQILGARSPSAMSNRSGGYPLLQQEPEVQLIKLNKSNNGMGLSIVAAKGAGQDKLGIYIKSVVKGGAADVDGQLQAGDQLLKVDGQSLVGITQEKAAEYLVRTGPTVTLEVAKQGAIYHGLATLLQQPSPVMGRASTSASRIRPKSELITQPPSVTRAGDANSTGPMSGTMSLMNLHAPASSAQPQPTVVPYQERLVDWNMPSGAVRSSHSKLNSSVNRTQKKDCNPNMYLTYHSSHSSHPSPNPAPSFLQPSCSFEHNINRQEDKKISLPSLASSKILVVPLSAAQITCGNNDECSTSPVASPFLETEDENNHCVDTEQISKNFQNLKFCTKYSKQVDESNYSANICDKYDNKVDFNPNIYKSNIARGVFEGENSSLSSIVSSGDNDESGSPCCPNDCCSHSSTNTSSDSSDQTKRYNRNDFSVNKNKFEIEEKLRIMKDVDEVLLGDFESKDFSYNKNKLDTDSKEQNVASGQRISFENIELLNDESSCKCVPSMLNLDLSSFNDELDLNGSSSTTLSKCWKSPDELGENGVFCLHNHNIWKIKKRNSAKLEMFKSVPNISEAGIVKEGEWNVPPQSGVCYLAPSTFEDSSPNSYRFVYTVGLKPKSVSLDNIDDNSENRSVQFVNSLQNSLEKTKTKECAINLNDNNKFCSMKRIPFQMCINDTKNPSSNKDEENYLVSTASYQSGEPFFNSKTNHVHSNENEELNNPIYTSAKQDHLNPTRSESCSSLSSCTRNYNISTHQSNKSFSEDNILSKKSTNYPVSPTNIWTAPYPLVHTSFVKNVLTETKPSHKMSSEDRCKSEGNMLNLGQPAYLVTRTLCNVQVPESYELKSRSADNLTVSSSESLFKATKLSENIKRVLHQNPYNECHMVGCTHTRNFGHLQKRPSTPLKIIRPRRMSERDLPSRVLNEQTHLGDARRNLTNHAPIQSSKSVPSLNSGNNDLVHGHLSQTATVNTPNKSHEVFNPGYSRTSSTNSIPQNIPPKPYDGHLHSGGGLRSKSSQNLNDPRSPTAALPPSGLGSRQLSNPSLHHSQYPPTAIHPFHGSPSQPTPPSQHHHPHSSPQQYPHPSQINQQPQHGMPPSGHVPSQQHPLLGSQHVANQHEGERFYQNLSIYRNQEIHNGYPPPSPNRGKLPSPQVQDDKSPTHTQKNLRGSQSSLHRPPDALQSNSRERPASAYIPAKETLGSPQHGSNMAPRSQSTRDIMRQEAKLQEMQEEVRRRELRGGAPVGAPQHYPVAHMQQRISNANFQYPNPDANSSNVPQPQQASYPVPSGHNHPNPAHAPMSPTYNHPRPQQLYGPPPTAPKPGRHGPLSGDGQRLAHLDMQGQPRLLANSDVHTAPRQGPSEDVGYRDSPPPPPPPTSTHPLYQTQPPSKQIPATGHQDNRYTASMGEPPRGSYYTSNPSGSGNSSQPRQFQFNATNPWEREEREKAEEFLRKHVRHVLISVFIIDLSSFIDIVSIFKCHKNLPKERNDLQRKILGEKSYSKLRYFLFIEISLTMCYHKNVERREVITEIMDGPLHRHIFLKQTTRRIKMQRFKTKNKIDYTLNNLFTGSQGFKNYFPKLCSFLNLKEWSQELIIF
ncbi:Kinesin-like protein unc-104 [Gryllus bimaculatus]|nr:Kinesin-like protein unc-104 [Gryllus bimaculatus]